MHTHSDRIHYVDWELDRSVWNAAPDKSDAYLFPINRTIYLSNHRDADHIQPVVSRDDNTTRSAIRIVKLWIIPHNHLWEGITLKKKKKYIT